MRFTCATTRCSRTRTKTSGIRRKYFNDRLIEVIDHLLATPDVKDPVALTQPNVQFEYADPKLESRSAGQKVLMRMGSANAAAVKAKLRALRARLVEQKPAK